MPTEQTSLHASMHVCTIFRCITSLVDPLILGFIIPNYSFPRFGRDLGRSYVIAWEKPQPQEDSCSQSSSSSSIEKRHDADKKGQNSWTLPDWILQRSRSQITRCALFLLLCSLYQTKDSKADISFSFEVERTSYIDDRMRCDGDRQRDRVVKFPWKISQNRTWDFFLIRGVDSGLLGRY